MTSSNLTLQKTRASLMRSLNALPKGYTTIVIVSEPEPMDEPGETLQFISGNIGDFHANIFELLQSVHGDDFDSVIAEKLSHLLAELSMKYSARSDSDTVN